MSRRALGSPRILFARPMPARPTSAPGGGVPQPVTTVPAGAFTFTMVLPGQYRAVAVALPTSGPPAADADTLEALAPSAVRVTVTAGQAARVELRLAK